MSTLMSYNGIPVVTPDPAGAGGLAINNNFKALSTHIDTVDPTAGDDSTSGYVPGSRWLNTASNVEWICLSNASGAAVWNPGGLPLAGGTMAGAINMGGQPLNLNTGSGTGGTALNLDKAVLALDSASAIQADGSGNIAVNGVTFNNNAWLHQYAPSQFYSYIIAFDTLSMAGTDLYMKDGSGSGGSLLHMDGGQIVQMRAENASAAPSSPNAGQIYFDTSTNHFYGVG